jgi:hypothetical protein
MVGFTLIMGAAFVSNLRLIGALLPERQVLEITIPAGRTILIGLLFSVTTGFLLFAPRAPTAAANGIFEVKMLLLVAAVLFHFTMHRRVARQPTATQWLRRATGSVGLALWMGLAVAGSAYILIE